MDNPEDGRLQEWRRCDHRDVGGRVPPGAVAGTAAEDAKAETRSTQV
jgi:hypothetical protein